MNNSTTTSKHICQHRDDDGGWWNVFLDWWILPAHLTFAVVFTCIVLKVLQGRDFLVSGSENHDYNSHTFRLYQSDVNTLLSLALVFIRTLTGCWLTLTGWRMALTSMERNGATLKEIIRMIDYRIPSIKPWDRARWKTKSFTVLAFTMWAIFLLGLPTQFVAPLVTGAINWIPGDRLCATSFSD
jgi:amino acid permease